MNLAAIEPMVSRILNTNALEIPTREIEDEMLKNTRRLITMLFPGGGILETIEPEDRRLNNVVV